MRQTVDVQIEEHGGGRKTIVYESCSIITKRIIKLVIGRERNVPGSIKSLLLIDVTRWLQTDLKRETIADFRTAIQECG